MSTQQTRKAVAIPEPSGTLAEPWSAGKLWRMLALFGPAAIVASVSIGAGETIIVVKTGSWAGYNLLWIEGVALAPDQLDFTNTPTSGTGLTSSSGLFLHGFSAGLEGRW